MNSKRFKVGDRVRIISQCVRPPLVGTEGTILKDDMSDIPYLIESLKDGREYWLEEDGLEALNKHTGGNAAEFFDESEDEFVESVMSARPKPSFSLLYTEDCDQKLKRFSSKEERNAFIVSLVVAKGKSEDLWIEALIDGVVELTADSGIGEGSEQDV